MMSFDWRIYILVLIIGVRGVQPTSIGFTADYWKATHTKFVRGSHWECLSSDLLSKYKACNGIDLFFQTNWNLSNNKKLFTDVFDIDAFEKVFINVDSFLKEYLKVSAILKKISIEDATLGTMVKFSTYLETVRIGVDIPVLYQVTHFWAGAADQEELKKNLSEIGDSSSALVPDLTFSEVDIERLNSLVLKKTEDIGIGDVRFYLEKNLLGEALSSKLVCGAEILLSFRKPDNNIPALLLVNRQKLTEEIVRKNINESLEAASTLFLMPDDTLGSQAYQDSLKRLKNDAYIFLENFFVTLRESRLKSQVDNYRSGIGFYARPTIFLCSEQLEIFARLKCNYLFSVNRMAVLTTRDYPDPHNALLENIGMSKEFSPVVVLQSTLGMAGYLGAFYVGSGYDFFYKSSERILRDSDSQINEPLDISGAVLTKPSEILASAQHRVFGSLGYRTALENKDIYAGLMLNYNFYSTGAADNSWGVALGVGIAF